MQSTIEGVTRCGLPPCHSPAIGNPASSATNKRGAPGNSRPSARSVLFEIKRLLNCLPKYRYYSCFKQPKPCLRNCLIVGRMAIFRARTALYRYRARLSVLYSRSVAVNIPDQRVRRMVGGKLFAQIVICGMPWPRLRMYQSDLSDVMSSSLC
jgi:hypothetical protein